MPNPFAHIELTSENLADSQKFYKAVFAWKLSPVKGMPYVMIDVAGGTGGGMQSKPMPEAPTGWLPYVEVDDVKKTMAKVVKAGGAPMLAYQDIGDMGAIGIFQDPQGTALGIWSRKSAPPKTAKKTAKKAAKKTAKKTAKKASKKKAGKKR
jgi:uncharacterized protein